MPETEKPRAEPEIILPGDLGGRPMREGYHFDVHGTQRIYVARLGPFGIFMLGLLIALIAAVIPIVLLGVVLIWIPLAVVFVVAAIVSDLLRRRHSTEAAPSPAEALASPPLAETTDALRDERASQLVDRLSLWSGAAGLVPLPLVDMAAVGGVQLYMLRRLSEIYEIPFSENLSKSILSSFAGAVVPATTAATAGSIMKGVPIVGTVIGVLTMPAVAAGATWIIGKVFIKHFASGGTLLDFDPPDYREFIKAQKSKFAVPASASATAATTTDATAGSETTTAGSEKTTNA
jgi:uncharacterized protein (DUF697 family)